MVLDSADVVLAVESLVCTRILDGLVDDEVLDGLQLLVHAVQLFGIEVTLLFLRLGAVIFVIFLIIIGATIRVTAFL